MQEPSAPSSAQKKAVADIYRVDGVHTPQEVDELEDISSKALVS